MSHDAECQIVELIILLYSRVSTVPSKDRKKYPELNRSIVLPLSSTVTTMTLVVMSLMMGTMLKVMMQRLVDKSSHRHH